MRTDSALSGIIIQETNSDGLITLCLSQANLSAVASKFAKGCVMVDVLNALVYFNAGTTAVPSWSSVSTITAPKVASAQAVTSTADGTGTGAIAAPTSLEVFVTATSASATNQISLPAITAASIGQKIYITVGANGYELVTPASSNNTINNVDADGTNQLDVAATTTVRCTQVTATGWICETIAATTIAITAPDND